MEAFRSRYCISAPRTQSENKRVVPIWRVLIPVSFRKSQ